MQIICVRFPSLFRMTEGRALAFNGELIFASVPKGKGVCHFAIKDIFSKRIKHHFSVMVPQW